MLIAARNGMMVGGKSLPYDAEVEWLECSGAQWIQTNVVADYTLKFQCRFMCVSGGGIIRFYGSRTSEAQSFVASLSNTYNVGFLNDYGSGQNGNRIVYPGEYYESFAGRWKHIEFGNRYIKDVETNTYLTSADRVAPPPMPPSAPLLFLAFQEANYISTGSVGRVSEAKFWKGDTLVHDFIPVRVGSVGYMYDRVSGELFGNQGTGAFVIGPDKVSSAGGGYKRKCVRRSYRRSLRPSARFWRSSRQLRNLFTVHSSLFVARREVA